MTRRERTVRIILALTLIASAVLLAAMQPAINGLSLLALIMAVVAVVIAWRL